MSIILRSPFDLVAEALDVTDNSITKESAMNRHHAWDSFHHLQVIVALEKHYGIEIPNDEFAKYDNMTAIIKLYEELSNRQASPKKGFFNIVKNIFVKKIVNK